MQNTYAEYVGSINISTFKFAPKYAKYLKTMQNM